MRKRDLDLTEWLEYFTFGLQWQLAEVQDKGETLIRMDVLAKKHQLVGPVLVALELDRMDQHSRCRISRPVVRDVDRRSLQRDLRELVDAGLLEATVATNRLVYMASRSRQN